MKILKIQSWLVSWHKSLFAPTSVNKDEFLFTKLGNYVTCSCVALTLGNRERNKKITKKHYKQLPHVKYYRMKRLQNKKCNILK